MKRKGENGALLLCFLLVLDLLDENDEFGKAEAAPKQASRWDWSQVSRGCQIGDGGWLVKSVNHGFSEIWNL
ncbi:hypothetical protein ACFX13_047026 [Malus domestica]|uniref:Uncharacterized protein n=1 Tax=Malus domestica TaxID=3750 RepID=A0A498J664_MALDO|nr:hypothetical protein DVH24_000550 [Malus domestica]